jgi:predicted metal-binding protein
MCPGTTCFKVANNTLQAFENVDEEIEILGFVTCGGCPGKKAIPRAIEAVKRGTDTIAFASCITKGNPIGFECPHQNQMISAVQNKINEKIRIIKYTH